MAEFIYIDNSNLFFAGKSVSFDKAQESGRTHESTYSLSFRHLYQFLVGSDSRAVKRCVLFGSRPPMDAALWAAAEQAGFRTILYDRTPGRGEKKVDAALVTHMIKDAYTVIDREFDTITLVTGDSDFVPAVDTLIADHFTVEVCFWTSASEELKRKASRFIILDGHIDFLTHQRLEQPVSRSAFKHPVFEQLKLTFP